MNSQSDNTSKDQPVDEPFQFINNGDVEDKEWAAHIRLLNDYPADMQLRNIIQYARSGPFYPADMHVDLIEQFIQAECNRAREIELSHVEPGARWFPHEDLCGAITVAERLQQLMKGGK